MWTVLSRRDRTRILPGPLNWTQCGFYIRLDFYLTGGDVQTLLVGIDDCKTFTAPDIHAVGQMANDYFYEHYVEKLRKRCVSILAAGLLTACTTLMPDPTVSVSPLRLPTRVPPTLTPTPTPLSSDARAYYEEGLAYQQAGDAENALRAFTQAIELAPDFASAYVARGGIYLGHRDYDLALANANTALEADPTLATAYALRGEALRLMGRPAQALIAFDEAVARDPNLKATTFHSRWLAARAAHAVPRLRALGQEYTFEHPDDPMGSYYRGWSLVEEGNSRAAISALLIRGIEAVPQPPALLWFALGQAYASENAWQEAIISFETAYRLVQSGDASLALHTDRPAADLCGALGRAYLGAGRCPEAEAMLKYAIEFGAPAAEYDGAIREARLCQTPTPTPTQYPTTTPPSGD